MKIIFGNHMGIGRKEKIIQDKPFFIAKDFPLPRKETTWKNFPTELIIQPEKIVPFLPIPSDYSLPPLISREDFPDFTTWEKNVTSVTSDPASKVVLARKTTLTFEDRIDPLEIINQLHINSSNSLVFGFILSQNLAFVGATPEILLLRTGKNLYTEALAGTRSIEEEELLLTSQKDLEEFNIVKNEIASRLRPISHHFTLTDDIYIKKTSHLCHLHYPFEVELKSQISDLEIIDSLHPTPAISGLPAKRSLEMIRDLEPFDRGWYSGAIGMVSNSHSEVYVALRSALICENKMHLFSGAGIVNDSVPTDEWQELNNKIAHFGI